MEILSVNSFERQGLKYFYSSIFSHLAAVNYFYIVQVYSVIIINPFTTVFLFLRFYFWLILDWLNVNFFFNRRALEYFCCCLSLCLRKWGFCLYTWTTSWLGFMSLGHAFFSLELGRRCPVVFWLWMLLRRSLRHLIFSPSL